MSIKDIINEYNSNSADYNGETAKLDRYYDENVEYYLMEG